MVMSAGYRTALIALLLLTARTTFARETPWYKVPGKPITLEASGFRFSSRAPRGWSIRDNALTPPAAFATNCEVTSKFYVGTKWSTYVLGLSAWPGEERTEYKIGGHPAVSIRHRTESGEETAVVIDLSDVRPDSLAVWRVAADRSQSGQDCEVQFIAVVDSSMIAFDVDAERTDRQHPSQ